MLSFLLLRISYKSGDKASVYAWAAIEQMVVTIKPNMLTLKIRTCMHASGRPGFAKLAPVDDNSGDRNCNDDGDDDEDGPAVATASV